MHYTDNLTEYTHHLVHNQDPSFPGGFTSNIPRGGFGRLAGQSSSAGYKANVTSADNESIPYASPATRCSFWQPMLKPKKTRQHSDDLVMRSQTAGSDPLRRTVHKRRLLTGDIFYWQWKVVNFISSKVVRLYIITSDNWKKLVLIIDLKPKDHFTTRRRELQLKHLPG